MRTSPLLLALPALATAQQIPFLDQLNPYIDQVKGYFGAATSTVASAASSAIPSSISIPNPAASAAAAFAATKVPRLTLENQKSLLVPSSTVGGPEEWLLFVTGGNKSCFGLCESAERAWNESVGLMSASSTPPHFTLLDCDDQGVLCAAWALSPPTVIHMLLPQPLPDQSKPATTVRSIHLNRTTVAAPEIAAIHLQETYKEVPPYEGLWHPFDGPLAEYGVQIPVGYALWGFSKVPSWAFMIGVSFLSRSFMSRRMGAAPARPAGGTPAPAT
ncbi:hypothetical protein B0A55_01271 [Friedmanniomyces simplex]|uniref:Uncharacterized protein n=1 Tax=Friedmanniomyces simplex TaxID=329884 RepID=A0A4V5NIF7_9PEZI|nr:hypothetical protein B0A55_01271 [Friedmanniomyces simplex]